MLLTFKIKHSLDLKTELDKARQVAEFAVANRDTIPNMSSKHVKQFGLASAVANQVLIKYKNDRTCKLVSNVNIIFPGQAVTIVDSKIIRIHARKDFQFVVDLSSCGNLKPFVKVNQVEASDKYFYVTVAVAEPPLQVTQGTIGVDLNIASASAVTYNSVNNDVIVLGRQQKHLRTKFFKRRQKLQRLKNKKLIKETQRLQKHKIKLLKQLKPKVKKQLGKESRCLNDLLHKVSRKIVNEAKKHQLAIVIEDLKDIRVTSKLNKKGKGARRSLHSWSYLKLRFMIEYKAKLLGVPVIVVEPAYTSQDCSYCGQRGNRKGDSFSCPSCRRAAHADINAARNLAQLGQKRFGLTAA
jgi:putative transposase